RVQASSLQPMPVALVLMFYNMMEYAAQCAVQFNKLQSVKLQSLIWKAWHTIFIPQVIRMVGKRSLVWRIMTLSRLVRNRELRRWQMVPILAHGVRAVAHVWRLDYY